MCCVFISRECIYNTNVGLVNDNKHTKFGLILFISSQENQILTSIKGRNSVANLRKTKIYKTYVDLVNDNVYIKFGLNLSIRSIDSKQKPNYDVNQGP